MQWFVCMDKYWSDQYVQFRKNFCARQSSNLQDAWQSKIVSVSLCHICWMDNFNAFILGCSALRKWRAKRATWSVIAATGGQAPKAPSPPQELGIANPRAARVCIPSFILKPAKCVDFFLELPDHLVREDSQIDLRYAHGIQPPFPLF